MDRITKFLKSRKAIRFATVTAMFLLSIHFGFIALFETNIIEEVISIGFYGLNRLVSLIICITLLIITFGAYRQDREIVNTRLQQIKEKISEEAKEIRDELTQKVEKGEKAK